MSTTIYVKTAGDLIREALRDATISGAEMPTEASDFVDAFTALNNVLTQWQTTGINLWRETEAFLPLNPDQNKYVLGVGGDHCFTDGVYTTASAFITAATTFTLASTAGMSAGQKIGFELATGARWWDEIATVDSPTQVTTVNGAPSAGEGTVYAYSDLIDQPVRILSARSSYRYNFDEIPTDQISRKEYYDQPSKFTYGDVTSWYYSRQLEAGHLMVWPVARTCRQVLRFSFVKPMTIPTDQANQVQIPQEWYMALRYAVAADLGIINAIDANRQMILEAKAEKYLAQALSIDVEVDSFSVEPA